MGDDSIGRREIGLHGRSAAALGPSGRAGRRKRPGLTMDERQQLKGFQRENFELKRANEILRKASAFFAQAELDRRPK
jgi:transposase-like protein